MHLVNENDLKFIDLFINEEIIKILFSFIKNDEFFGYLTRLIGNLIEKF